MTRKCHLCGRATTKHGPHPDMVICTRANCKPERDLLQWRLMCAESFRSHYSWKGELPEEDKDRMRAALEAEAELYSGEL